MKAVRESLAILTCVAFAVLAVGCSPRVAPAPPQGPAPDTVQEATLDPGQPLPRPRDRVVLTIKGAGHPNSDDRLDLDIATLEQMGVVELTVSDRTATGRTATFTGPLLSSVLTYAGLTGTTIHLHALNDYSVDIPVAEAKRLPIILATRMDGELMTVENYGPTRIIYPTNGWGVTAEKDPRWIWQLDSLSVS